MKTSKAAVACIVSVSVALVAGCAAPKVDFSTIERPARAAELDAYDVFVGSWDWQAKLINAEGEDEAWTGSAKWDWALDKRCLHGQMSVKGANAEFDAAGIWSWHPGCKKYAWWMFNNWGYPQQGTARYDADDKHWTMPYKSIGLDGTCSYGVYTMKVVDPDTLEWTANEWADAMHMFKKMEMTGTYKRQG